MTRDWTRCKRSLPCPQCGKFDFCRIGTKVVHCMRIASDKPNTGDMGGWFHPLSSQAKQFVRELEKPKVRINAVKMMAEWTKRTSVRQYALFAHDLGVDLLALRMLSPAWSYDHQAWAFPMRWPNGLIVGIRLRFDDGRKLAVTGSHSGLFIPTRWDSKRAWIAEGASDVCALLTLGLPAVGRASCNEGGAMLAKFIRLHGIREVVIVADHDTDKFRPDASRYNPGIGGAKALAAQLPVRSCVWLPPCKDAREYLRAGGTKQLIESQIQNLVWKQPSQI